MVPRLLRQRWCRTVELRIRDLRNITYFNYPSVKHGIPPFQIDEPRIDIFAKSNLKKYLNCVWCRKYRDKGNEFLLAGYCKESQKEYKINVPLYLIQIILKYYPTFTD